MLGAVMWTVGRERSKCRPKLEYNLLFKLSPRKETIFFRVDCCSNANQASRM